MHNRELIQTVLSQIFEASERIKRRFSGVQSPDDFLKSDEGIDRLDAICTGILRRMVKRRRKTTPLLLGRRQKPAQSRQSRQRLCRGKIDLRL